MPDVTVLAEGKQAALLQCALLGAMSSEKHNSCSVSSSQQATCKCCAKLVCFFYFFFLQGVCSWLKGKTWNDVLSFSLDCSGACMAGMFYLLVFWAVTSLFFCCLGRLCRCSGFPNMSCMGPQERDGSTCCVQNIAMWSVTTSGDTWRNREQTFLQRSPKRTVWTSEEGHNSSLPLFEVANWCCAAVSQADINLWSSCWARLSALWVWLPTSSRVRPWLDPCTLSFSTSSWSRVCGDLSPKLRLGDASQTQIKMCWGGSCVPWKLFM